MNDSRTPEDVVALLNELKLNKQQWTDCLKINISEERFVLRLNLQQIADGEDWKTFSVRLRAALIAEDYAVPTSNWI